MRNKQEKAFTLIELLVVIAIVGLLSSIVLVALKGGREKASTAKTLEWARSVEAQLGGDLVGSWNFNEGTGTTAYDASGYNNGTLGGTCGATCAPQWTDGVQGLTGKALYFDGGDYVDVGSLTTIGNEVTIELWMNANAFGWGMPFSANQGNNDLGIFLQNSNVIWFRTSNSTSYSDYTITNANINNGQWYHLAVTRKSDGTKTVYGNGVALSGSGGGNSWQNTISGAKIGARTSLAAGYFFNGAIDEVRIYSRALTAMEIQKHYAEGLARHQFAEKR